MKYIANLINDQGCQFDRGEFLALDRLKKWARGRGNEYKCYVFEHRKNKRTTYKIKNERMYKVHSC